MLPHLVLGYQHLNRTLHQDREIHRQFGGQTDED